MIKKLINYFRLKRKMDKANKAMSDLERAFKKCKQ